MNEFNEWLQGELNSHGWNQSDLATRGGFARSSISMIFTQDRQPGADVCRGIAKALELTEEFVFRKAGLLSPQSGYDVTYEEWRAVLHELTEDNRDELLQFARLRLERQRDQAFTQRFTSLSPDQQAEAWRLIEDLIQRKGWKFEE